MTSDLRNRSRRVLEEFLNIYKSQPCLWYVKSKDYHNKAKKNVAYGKLIEKYKEIDPYANRETIVKKINSFRTNYRKEKRKVEQLQQSGMDSGDIRVPSLWYYNMLEFLNDQDAANSTLHDLNENIDIKDPLVDDFQTEDADPIAKFETIQLTPIGVSDLNTNNSSHNQLQLVTCSSENSGPTKRTIPENCDRNSESFESSYKKSKTDKHEIFGKNVSMKLQDMANNTQRLLAEKLINEALFMGEMGQLTLSHYIVGPDVTNKMQT